MTTEDLEYPEWSDEDSAKFEAEMLARRGGPCSSFDNARTNLWNLLSISGLDIEEDWLTYFEMYRDVFMGRLDQLGITNEDDFVALLKTMDQYGTMGWVLCDDASQQAEYAAYGLIVFDRLMRAEKAGVSHAEFFNMTQELLECHTPIFLAQHKSIQARISGQKAHQKTLGPRAWVASEWDQRADLGQSKAAFSLQYAHLVKKKFGFTITPDTIARAWLPKDTKPTA